MTSAASRLLREVRDIEVVEWRLRLRLVQEVLGSNPLAVRHQLAESSIGSS